MAYVNVRGLSRYRARTSLDAQLPPCGGFGGRSESGPQREGYKFVTCFFPLPLKKGRGVGERSQQYVLLALILLTDTKKTVGGFFVACLYPKICFIELQKDGKKKLRFLSGSEKYEVSDLGSCYFDNLDLHSEHSGRGYYVKIPCGQCIQCRLAYAREWASRIMLEAKGYPENQLAVLTLTYDDAHLPEQLNIGQESFFYSHPLVKEHMSQFMKRLRKGVKDKFDMDGVRFFGCGEYGDKSMRPHFHIIIFGCPVFDLIYHSKSHAGFPNYTSAFFQSFWQFGFVTVNKLSYDIASYVARYTLKKTNAKDKEFYALRGLSPEFVNMSRKPGIGSFYFDDNKDSLAETLNVSVLKGDKPVTLPLPRYFVSKLEEEGFFVDKIGMYNKSLKTDLDRALVLSSSYQQYLESEREKSREVQSRLVRDLI